jgi:hypothetical protein
MPLCCRYADMVLIEQGNSLLVPSSQECSFPHKQVRILYQFFEFIREIVYSLILFFSRDKNKICEKLSF